jgi:hypothetical protein
MSYKSIIIWVVLLIGILGMLSWVGIKGDASLPVGSQIESGTALTVDEPIYDFGEIKIYGGDVVTTFVVSNKTESSIRIDSIVTSCMCTTAYIIDGDRTKGPFGMPGHGTVVPRANEVIESGEERIIRVVFDPAAHGDLGLGFVDRYVYLVDQNGGATILEARATVIR